MDQKWLLILVILVFCQKITSGAVKNLLVTEGQRVDITCKPGVKEKVSMIIWFRVTDDTFHMEFIGSFSTTGIEKSVKENYKAIFSYTDGQLTLKSFKKSDSGMYGCAALHQGTKMEFGEVTRISEAKTIAMTKAPPICTTIKSVSQTTACQCKDKNTSGNSSMDCAPIILGPLAGGCGLLLLLLIVTILYCNRIRTRRCPHHHKRRPRTAPPEKPMMASRYV